MTERPPIPNSLATDGHWARMIMWLQWHRRQLVIKADGEVELVRAHYNVRGRDPQDTDPKR